MNNAVPAVHATFGNKVLFDRYTKALPDLVQELRPFKLTERNDPTHGVEVCGTPRKNNADPHIIRVLVSGLYLSPMDAVMRHLLVFFRSNFPEVTEIELRVRGDPDPHALSYKKY